ncbi:hypothetical protein OAD61_00650 [bacterium]|nr:hypothetical protein [bacterium]
MTQKDTELIIDAIDFYNLNHLRGKETKKQLNKAKAKVQALNIHNVTTRNWFEKLPLHWKLAYHLIGGIVIGYLLHYVW